MKKLIPTKITLQPLIVASLFLLPSTALLAQNSNTDFYDADRAKQERSSNETKSVLGGAVIGGLVAGPPGAIITTIFGAMASNHFSSEKENKQLQANLEQTQTELIALQEQQKNLEARYQLTLEETQNLGFRNVNLPGNIVEVSCCADSEIALHFKTNSSDIELHYREKLEELANLSSIIPDAIIEVTGYADRRGINGDNLGLSRRRINSVKNSLTSLGVDSNIIQSNAFGENHPLSPVESLEGNFFDRRVDVRIRSANNDFITLSE
jgi:peptidoglycan-associated lipoprotein